MNSIGKGIATAAIWGAAAYSFSFVHATWKPEELFCLGLFGLFATGYVWQS